MFNTATLFRQSQFLFLAAALVFTSCNKNGEDSGPGPGPGGLTLNSPPTILTTVNGTPLNMVEGGDITAFAFRFPGPPWMYMSGLGNEETEEAYLITLGHIDGEAEPSSAQFSAFFATGPRDFTQLIGSQQGVEVAFVDADGEYWATTCGPQNGSTFNITQIQSVTGGPFAVMRVLGNFACTLYNCANPSMTKVITNGQFRLDFQNA